MQLFLPTSKDTLSIMGGNERWSCWTCQDRAADLDLDC